MTTTTTGNHRAGWTWSLAAAGAQLLALLLTYDRLLRHPGQYLLAPHYDGAKSYYSLATLLQQPLSQQLLEHGQNYPFGEYLFYTDVAPLLAVPLHALVQLVPALAPYGLYLFNVFFLLGLVGSAALLASILRRLGVPLWLALGLSVALPWLNPQTFRLYVGHLALTYGPGLLLPLWLLQGLYLAQRAGRPTGGHWAALGTATALLAWVHFYYLGVVGGWLAFFLLAWVGQLRQAGQPWRPVAAAGTGLLLGVAAGTFGLLQLLDARRAERPIASHGYGLLEWKLQLGTLFQGYDFYKIRFPLERTGAIPYESTAYLGAFVLYGLLAVATLGLLQRYRRRTHPAAPLLPTLPGPADDARSFVGLLLLASLPLLLAALGENMELDGGQYVVHNYLNPFFWVHKLTDRITQFRALGRFVWPFWWALALGVAWYVGLAWRQATRRWQQALWLGIGALAAVDALHAARYYHETTQLDNPFSAAALAPARQQLGWSVVPGRYQALLVLPYYHSGTEATEPPLFNVEPDEPLCTRSYQLALAAGLPMFNHKATRSISADARTLVGMFGPGGPAPSLLQRFDQRPVLVYLDTLYFNGQNSYYRDQLRDRPEVLELINRAPAFVREQHMKPLYREGTVSLYEWQPHRPQ